MRNLRGLNAITKTLCDCAEKRKRAGESGLKRQIPQTHGSFAAAFLGNQRLDSGIRCYETEDARTGESKSSPFSRSGDFFCTEVLAPHHRQVQVQFFLVQRECSPRAQCAETPGAER